MVELKPPKLEPLNLGRKEPGVTKSAGHYAKRIGNRLFPPRSLSQIDRPGGQDYVRNLLDKKGDHDDKTWKMMEDELTCFDPEQSETVRDIINDMKAAKVIGDKKSYRSSKKELKKYISDKDVKIVENRIEEEYGEW